MEFALTEDQSLLQASLTGLLSSVCALDEVRKVASGDEARAAAMTSELEQMGTVQLLVPEAYGGLGLGALDAVLVQETLGQYVSPAHFMAGSCARGLRHSYGWQSGSTGRLVGENCRWGYAHCNGP